jgi:hypothetical protein
VQQRIFGMKNIKKIVRSDAAFEILDNSNCAGTDWGSGGCAILAQALNKLEGYPMVVIYNLDYEGPEHFGVMTPSGTIIDHDGEHKGVKAWLNFFVSNEHPREGVLTVEYFTPDMDLNGIKFDSEASDKLAELIKNYQMIRETVRQVLREEREVEGIDDKTKLSVFDFDSTLVMTPVPETGASEWEEKTGTPWEGRWWDNPNSLNTEVFEMPVNPSVLSAYRREKSNPHNLVVMLTGRNQKMSKYVEKILDMHGLVFDDYLYNDGGETSSNKMMKMELALKYNPNIRSVEMWDDRTSHISTFQKWGDAMVEQGYLDSFKINHVK